MLWTLALDTHSRLVALVLWTLALDCEESRDALDSCTVTEFIKYNQVNSFCLFIGLMGAFIDTGTLVSLDDHDKALCGLTCCRGSIGCRSCRNHDTRCGLTSARTHPSSIISHLNRCPDHLSPDISTSQELVATRDTL